MGGLNKGKRPPSFDSDDDFEYIPPKKKVSLSELSSEIKGIRKQIDAVFRITQNMKIPPGLLRQLRESFQCYICRSTIVPPVIFARCCKRIIGCQTCIDQWYQGAEGTSRSCPICRFERAFTETTVLRGLDDFLQAITPLLRNSDMPEPEDPEQDDSD